MNWPSPWTLADIQALTSIFQNLVIVFATLVGAWWAYATFGYKEKTDELLTIARKIVEIHSHIEGSALTYSLYKALGTLGKIGPQNFKKLEEVKQAAETRVVALRYELNDLRDLSLRLPIVFKILDLGEYELKLLSIGGIERWGEKEVKDELLQAKLKILTKIYSEVNSYGSLIRKMNVKIQNIVYFIRTFFKGDKKL